MASTINTNTFAPQTPSPLARTTSPFKDPRPSPCVPTHTARLWDVYERRAVENARRRETTSAPHVQPMQRLSSGTVHDVLQDYIPHVAPTGIHHGSLPGGTSRRRSEVAPTTVTICKMCKQAITSISGICEKCKKTVVLPCPGEATPPTLSPTCRNFASMDLARLQKESVTGLPTPLPLSKRRSRQSSSTQLADPPIRLSSLPSRSSQDNSQAVLIQRCRNGSLTESTEPFMRLQISRKPVPCAQPPSPTTPPSTSRSHASSTSTRPSSLAKITTSPQYTTHPRHESATPSELSTLSPYISNATTASPSDCRASYSLQNTTSAWDEWDSDEEEKAGLVGYWRSRKWRGSRGSLSGAAGRRESAGRDEPTKEEGGRKRLGFVKVISCGCARND